LIQRALNAVRPPTVWKEHWLLDCAALMQAQMDIFGRHDLSLDILCTSARQEVITLAGRTLFGGPLWRARHHQQQQQQQQQRCRSNWRINCSTVCLCGLRD